MLRQAQHKLSWLFDLISKQMNVITLGWRNIWRNKRRTAITIASVLFAVLFAVVMRSFQEGTYGHAIDNMVRLISGHLQLQSEEYWDDQVIDNSFHADTALISAIVRIPEVEYAFPRMQYFAFAATEEITREAMVFGADLATEEPIAKLEEKLLYGSFPEKGTHGGVLLSEGLAQNLGVIYYTDSIIQNNEQGTIDTVQLLHMLKDTVVLLGQGFHGASAAGAFHVAGVVKLPIPDLNKRVVYMQLEAAQFFYSAENMVTSVNIQLFNADDQASVAHTLHSTVIEQGLSINTWQIMHRELLQQIESDKGSGMITIALLYLIIGFGILGTIIMMVAERKKEFGILVAIGMQRRLLSLQIATEMLLMGMAGAVSGAVLSAPILLYYYRHPIKFTGELAKAYESYGWEAVMPVTIELDIFINQSVVVLVLFALSSVYAYVNIYRLDVKTAIHK